MRRRDFLKVMGWSGASVALAACDQPSYVASREGRENVVPYVVPEEFVVPGIGVYYASTCLQCPSGCGTHTRVREGRALKMEGNPQSPLNRGKLCAMGQAAVQTHYNPDRLTKPQIRKGDRYEYISWDDALKLLREKVGSDSGLRGDRLAWVTDTISGHQAVLLAAFMESVGSSHHYVHETVNDSVWRAVCRDTLGEENPRLRLEKARVILSFGADFIGTWGTPVGNAVRYAEFRTSPRGMLIQAEPKMTVTGANADLWVPVRPGAEGVLALGIANVLAAKHGRDLSALPGEVRSQIASYAPQKAAEITGTPEQYIIKIADVLNERSPSLVLAGASAEGHESGYDSAAAAMTLNLILGNVGKTIESGSGFPFPQLLPKSGDTRSLVDFANALSENRYDVVFFKGANPVFSAPPGLKLRERLASVPFKVALTAFEDETSRQADLVLPLYSALEDWGTHVPAAQPERMFISIQQPVMDPLYPETRGFGDVLLQLLKMRNDKAYSGFEDYYAYLRHAFAALPASIKGGADDKAFWNAVLQKGVLEVGAGSGAPLKARPVSFTVAEPPRNDRQPYFLLASASPVMWDGRHANVPWLQELPDPISKAVWDSWAEMHPSTAKKLGVRTGDIISLTSDHGSIQTRVYVYKGMHPDAIAIPLGQGHEVYGRYAKGRGVNPLSIVGVATDKKTGQLAHHGTPVAAAVVYRRPDRVETAGTDRLVQMGGSESQLGRKLVATVTADRYERTEGRRV
jgi:anaerobic selenocysteine-containing dehydrogenase